MSGRKRLTKNSEGLRFFDRLRMSEGDRMTQNEGVCNNADGFKHARLQHRLSLTCCSGSRGHHSK